MGAAAQRRGAASRPQPSPGRDQGAPKAHGPVAQLVEQRVYTAAVVGSSPAGSTMTLHARGGRLAARPALLARLAKFDACSPRARMVVVCAPRHPGGAAPWGSRFGDVASARIVRAELA